MESKEEAELRNNIADILNKICSAHYWCDEDIDNIKSLFNKE